jgi:hypothetical protein
MNEFSPRSPFAPAFKDIAKPIGVAAAPTGGKGLALDPTGKVPTQTLVEAWHEIGVSGEPAFENSWVNFDAANEATAAFYKDALGIVHLKGVVKSGTVNARMFTLPDGYRPKVPSASGKWRYPVISYGVLGVVRVGNDGDVTLNTGSNVYADLSPVQFRAA